MTEHWKMKKNLQEGLVFLENLAVQEVPVRR